MTWNQLTDWLWYHFPVRWFYDAHWYEIIENTPFEDEEAYTLTLRVQQDDRSEIVVFSTLELTTFSTEEARQKVYSTFE